MPDLDLIVVSADQWAAWRAAARALGDDGKKLENELEEARLNPTRQNLRRCASTARRVAHRSKGDAQHIARGCWAHIKATLRENATGP